jgi:hypothetical protein
MQNKFLVVTYLVGLRCVVRGSVSGLFFKTVIADALRRSMSESLRVGIDCAAENWRINFRNSKIPVPDVDVCGEPCKMEMDGDMTFGVNGVDWVGNVAPDTIAMSSAVGRLDKLIGGARKLFIM